MSGWAVRAWARDRFLFVFLLLFSLCQMGGLERREQGEEAISATVQAKHQPQPWIERLGHYETWWGWGGDPLCKRRCCAHSIDAGHFARLVKMSSWWCQLKVCVRVWAAQDGGVGVVVLGGGGWSRLFFIEHHQSALVPPLKTTKLEYLKAGVVLKWDQLVPTLDMKQGFS